MENAYKKINIMFITGIFILLIYRIYMLTHKTEKNLNMPTANIIQKGEHISKTAIILSGRIKGYKSVESNLLSIQKKYNATIFCSLNNKIKSDYISTFCNVFNITDKQLNLEKTVVPEWVYKLNRIEGSSYDRAYSMFYHTNRSFNLVEIFQNENNIKFDCILYYRADIDSKDVISLIVPNRHTIYIPHGLDYDGLNDRVAYGDFESMKQYSNLVNHIRFLCTVKGVLFHPETLLKAYLENEKLNINRFDYHFSLHPSRHDYIEEHDAYE